MSNLNFKRFSDPDLLRKIGREHLLLLLQPHAVYLKDKGCVLPFGNEGIDFDSMAMALATPDDSTPKELAEALYYIHEMSTEDGMDGLVSAVDERKKLISAGGGDGVTDVSLSDNSESSPSDIAVQVWLQDQEMLREVHDRAYLNSPRTFVSFTAEAKPKTEFVKPVPFLLGALEDSMDVWFNKKKRGTGCKVSPYMLGKECWCLVRHGMPMRRDGAMEDGKPTGVVYRPQKHDVVIYDSELGDLRVHAKTKGERELYRRKFGLYLFNDEDWFGEAEKYTLAPLIDRGRDALKPMGKPGIEKVTLVEVESIYGAGDGAERVTRKATDIFSRLEARNKTFDSLGTAIRVVLSIKFIDQDKARTVSIRPANKVTYQRIDDAEIVEPWLEAQEFVILGDEEAASEEDVA